MKLTTGKYTHYDWLDSVQDDSADYPIVCDSFSDNRPRVVKAMPPSISALSSQEEENVKEVLGNGREFAANPCTIRARIVSQCRCVAIHCGEVPRIA